METVFITIHDLSLDARIKYVSDSVEDILGYLPEEVKGKSCWEYFHPDEIPFARAIHGRGIQLDKAAVLNYCQIKHKDGSWVGCECVFTVVYDVLVASTSIYRRGPRSEQRASEAPAIRRIFSSSPRDPRYHMLSYMSNKFYKELVPNSHEPRAALFLNRFTRTSTIMFATESVASILGIPADQITGKSFYFCIAENCLSDAVRCLESAKANDSIAYLRFWFRNPLLDDQGSRDASMADPQSSDDDDADGGVRVVASPNAPDPPLAPLDPLPAFAVDTAAPVPVPVHEISAEENHRSLSGNSTDLERSGSDTIFDVPALEPSRSSSSSIEPLEDPIANIDPVEVEAVISCTSDGLVVVLRRARPMMPPAYGAVEPEQNANGIFASPWGLERIVPEGFEDPVVDKAADRPDAALEDVGVMSAIREVAVFAWALTGINGSLADIARGRPSGESQPPGGIPIWDPASNADPENKFNGFSGGTHRPIDEDQLKTMFDDTKVPNVASLKPDKGSDSSSEDEILWKRAPTMPEWRRPPRRAHGDAFGAEGDDRAEDEEATPRRRKRLDY